MTPTATIAVLALALLVGISLGLLGGGGSILAVPILTAVGGVEPRAAIASSLLIVGTTSALGLLQHARAGRVRWRVGVVFGAAGVVGALVGGLLGRTLPPGVLMVLLAGTMIAAAVAMLRRRPRHDRAEPARPRIALVLVLGTVVGSLAGLVGAGGGFLIVPALILLAGLPASAAIGTSLLVIAMQSLAGLAAQPALPDIPWALVLPFTAIAVAGSFLGSALTGRIPERALRTGFAVLVLSVAVALLVQQLALHLPLT
ncbi:sulfite exporter TauE/SafE family protein [Microbacterium oleivorans]|uniref:sulfite exporter TauE/SafE family protein n=1 Tax=Microbacteriaceae TaxID=85023 RepID=UPI00051A79D8|nr:MULTISPECIES: sulfite exporter TauE/SafE family protein [Microbacteriaceae]